MGGTPDILTQIAEIRRTRLRSEGAAQGLKAPPVPFPLVDFLSPDGLLIAELKRKSPSRGRIAPITDPTKLATDYLKAGFRRVSVLTEQDHFGGSLADMVAVKTAHPHLAVLRKDFLLTVEDVELSRRFGADALLLIAALLDEKNLSILYRRCTELGMTALVEVHDTDDIAKVRSLAPPLLGINSRDLRSFRVKPLLPLELRSAVDWPCTVIYESGINTEADVLFVRGCGFGGFLVGGAVAGHPALAARLTGAWKDDVTAERLYGAWARLFAGNHGKGPLVKICGITNRRDAEAAVEAGADMLGFILADSPRRTDAETVRSCADLKIPKAGVVVLPPQGPVPPDAAALVEEGSLDFLQFHGDESPQLVGSWPSYKALRLRSPDDVEALDKTGSPAVLVDAFSSEKRGGTGKRLSEDLVEAVSQRRRLWLAGGLNPENVGAVVRRWRPGLVDVSSGVETVPGRKDHDGMKRFVKEASP